MTQQTTYTPPGNPDGDTKLGPHVLEARIEELERQSIALTGENAQLRALLKEALTSLSWSATGGRKAAELQEKVGQILGGQS